MDTDMPMSQPASGGSIAPIQASRLITAERRRAMAEERARVLRLRRPSPPVLEAAAAQWQREQEARKRAEPGRSIASRQAEMPPFSLQRVALPAEDLPPADETFWNVYTPRQPQSKRAPRRGRIGGFPVGAFAGRLIRKERAGGGWIAMDPRSRALEAAARRWEEQRTRDGRSGEGTGAVTEFGPTA